MKRTIVVLIAACFLQGVLCSQEGRQRMLLDFQWKFKKGDMALAHNPDLDDSSWRVLDLPHDWSIEGTFARNAPAGGRGAYLPGGTGWYRKTLELEASDLDKTIWIEFDGIYMNSDVWINGHHLGRHPYGYTGFYYDLTPYLHPGKNLLAVRVDNSLQPNSRWYSGSGIYRHVWLTLTDPLHVTRHGIYVTTPDVTVSWATVNIRTRMENSSSALRRATLRSAILDAQGEEITAEEIPIALQEGRQETFTQQLALQDPRFWSVETPSLYTLQTDLVEEGNLVDRVTTPFGVRTIEYDADKGFILNGEQVKMKGVCLHHDGGPVGAAVPARVWERRLELLKEMGCNAIRTAHNPMAPEFMDLCDRMGFLVMDEIFDEWTVGKVEHGYHRYFNEWSQKDLVSFIHRDRNHPSVVMWSAGNEIGEQSTEQGHRVLEMMIETFHREDPTRPVTTGNDHIASDDHITNPEFFEMLDIVGYNYVDRWRERRELYYSVDKLAHPDWKMVGTECVSIGGIRGSYFPGAGSGVFRSAYNTRMIRAEQLWKFEAVHDYVIGDFMWTGIDYLGEARWPHKNASSGVLDMCGFPKDGYFFYRSQWTEDPVLHIFPHWNWQGSEGRVLPVLAYTNCDTVELFLNGKSFGVKSYQFPRQGNTENWLHYDKPFVPSTTADLHLSWDVPYEPGTLRAVGKKNGRTVIERIIKTTGEPAAVRLTADRQTIHADAMDVVHVTVEIVDRDGLPVPTADNGVVFTLEGEGALIGVGNGDPTDHGSFQARERRVFHGLALAIVQSTSRPGRITFSAASDGLEGDSIVVMTE
ncbi:MAG: glycoside hydrolase family 2 TIM barrel-domain containing protein [Bacteroidota bacterium]